MRITILIFLLVLFGFSGMAQDIPGTVVAAKITTGSTNNQFSIGDSSEMQGTPKSVATIALRNAISGDRRTEGLDCWVIAETNMYRLVGGTNNSNWVIVTNSASGGLSVTNLVGIGIGNDTNAYPWLNDIQAGSGPICIVAMGDSYGYMLGSAVADALLPMYPINGSYVGGNYGSTLYTANATNGTSDIYWPIGYKLLGNGDAVTNSHMGDYIGVNFPLELGYVRANGAEARMVMHTNAGSYRIGIETNGGTMTWLATQSLASVSVTGHVKRVSFPVGMYRLVIQGMGGGPARWCLSGLWETNAPGVRVTQLNEGGRTWQQFADVTNSVMLVNCQNLAPIWFSELTAEPPPLYTASNYMWLAESRWMSGITNRDEIQVKSTWYDTNVQGAYDFAGQAAFVQVVADAWGDRVFDAYGRCGGMTNMFNHGWLYRINGDPNHDFFNLHRTAAANAFLADQWIRESGSLMTKYTSPAGLLTRSNVFTGVNTFSNQTIIAGSDGRLEFKDRNGRNNANKTLDGGFIDDIDGGIRLGYDLNGTAIGPIVSFRADADGTRMSNAVIGFRVGTTEKPMTIVSTNGVNVGISTNKNLIVTNDADIRLGGPAGQRIFSDGARVIITNDLELRRIVALGADIDFTGDNLHFNGQSVLTGSNINSGQYKFANNQIAIAIGVPVTNANVRSYNGTNALTVTGAASFSGAVTGQNFNAYSIVTSNNPANVLWFGADRTGAADSSPAFQAAIDSLPALGGEVFIPAGRYLLNSQVSLVARDATYIHGEGQTSSRITWNGSAGGKCIFGVTNCWEPRFENLYLEGKAGAAPYAAIRFHTDDAVPFATNGGSAGHAILKHLKIDGLTTGLTNGIAWSFTAPEHNNDQGQITDVVVFSPINAAFLIAGTQSLLHRFSDCYAIGGKFGVLTEANGGQFNWYGGFMGNHTTADFWVTFSNLSLDIVGVRSESSVQFLHYQGAQSISVPIRVSQTSFQSSAITNTQRGIEIYGCGPVYIQGNTFYYGTHSTYNSNHIYLLSAGGFPGKCIVQGNLFGATNMDMVEVGFGNWRVEQSMNLTCNDDGSAADYMYNNVTNFTPSVNANQLGGSPLSILAGFKFTNGFGYGSNSTPSLTLANTNGNPSVFNHDGSLDLGVGSPSPGRTLLVSSNMTLRGNMYLSTNGPSVQMEGHHYMGIDWLPNSWSVRNHSNGNFIAAFLENGNAGVGTPVPTAKLEVAGTANSYLLRVNTNTFVITNGTVGIGTATPSTLLDIRQGNNYFLFDGSRGKLDLNQANKLIPGLFFEGGAGFYFIGNGGDNPIIVQNKGATNFGQAAIQFNDEYGENRNVIGFGNVRTGAMKDRWSDLMWVTLGNIGTTTNHQIDFAVVNEHGNGGSRPWDGPAYDVTRWDADGNIRFYPTNVLHDHVSLTMNPHGDWGFNRPVNVTNYLTVISNIRSSALIIAPNFGNFNENSSYHAELSSVGDWMTLTRAGIITHSLSSGGTGNKALIFTADSAGDYIFNSGGNVGIGTTTPSQMLSVAGASSLPTNVASFTITNSASLSITNGAQRGIVVMKLAFDDAVATTPSCSITATNLAGTNSFGTLSPIALGLTASITNDYTYPLQPSEILRVVDTSGAGAAVRMIQWKLYEQ